MVVIRQRSSVHDGKSLGEESGRRRRPQSASSFAEMAGGTTADIAAVACLAPYSVANLVVLAAYRAPADLYHKAVRERRRRRLMKSGMLHTRSLSVDDHDLFLSSSSALVSPAEGDAIPEEDLQEMEKQMWERFSGTGFWRSPSQKHV